MAWNERMWMRRAAPFSAFLCLALLALAPLAFGQQLTERRIALVIGNSAYSGALTPLTNPVADADRIAQALSQAGFAGQITTVRNRTRAQILDDVRALAGKLREAGPDAVGFFYYSGHGGSANVGDQRRNFLIPVGAPISKGEDLLGEGVALDDVIAILSAAKARAVFVVFDACRTELPWSKGGGDPDKSFGVAPARPGLFIAFATAEGATAPDDGAFSKAVASEIVKPGQSHLVAFDAAARAVAARRSWDRLPWYSNQISGDPIYFRGQAPAPVVASITRAQPTQTGPFRDCPSCPEMVPLAGGKFRMGSSGDEPRRSPSEGPQRDLTVEPFALARTETTEAQWAACVADKICRPRSQRGPDFPVEGIGLSDAQDFIRWLNARGSGTYRLPSEAEWEYAARAGSGMPFAFGPSLGPNQATYDWATSYNNAPTRSPAPTGPTPVASYAPNAFGLYDMHGNLFEWVDDCYGPYDPKATTAAPAQNALCPQRILRGGSWLNKAWNVRSAFREPKPPTWADKTVGLRVARTLP